MISNLDNTSVVNPPWHLKGKGFIYFFWGKRRVDIFSGKCVAGIGAMIVAVYEESPVGPYNELLYIPGRQALAGKKGFFISKIYVDNKASIEGGRANWGIPKEYADFNFKETDSSVSMQVGKNGNNLFSSIFSKSGFRFPISTKVLPIALVQELNNQRFMTKFKGYGMAKWSKVKIEFCDEGFFENIGHHKILGGVAVQPFHLTFPTPLIF